MKTALLGYAQSGKRTLFSLLTGREVADSAKAGESIEGHADVCDVRVDRIADICRPEKIKYAENLFVLCPDVCSGAEARGWLDAARKCDLTCMLIRAYQDDSVYHPAGSVDEDRDRRELDVELILADLDVVEKRLVRMEKEKRAGQTAAQALEEKVLERCRVTLESEGKLLGLNLEEHEYVAISSLGLLTMKPVLWVYNVGEEDIVEGGVDARVSCKIEREIMGIEDPAERNEYLATLGVGTSGVDRVNSAAYEALGLMSFYTMGKDEVRAWTIRKGSTAPAAAGKVHSDMERGFIRAEVTKYDDLIAAGSEAAVKEQGRMLLKGKNYIIEDGDICSFLFNV